MISATSSIARWLVASAALCPIACTQVRVAPAVPCAGHQACCPARLPGERSACATASLLCEYGDRAFPGCNTLAQCVSRKASSGSGGSGGNVWVLHRPGSVIACSAVGSSSACPARRLSDLKAPEGHSPARSCALPDGNLCEYQSGPRPFVDGWRCLADRDGCMPRPRIGTRCASSRCSYGYGNETCVSGRWTVEMHASPPAPRP